eukprot:Ihof_evm8s85 gene=Ihof_evmTU8s85
MSTSMLGCLSGATTPAGQTTPKVREQKKARSSRTIGLFLDSDEDDDDDNKEDEGEREEEEKEEGEGSPLPLVRLIVPLDDLPVRRIEREDQIKVEFRKTLQEEELMQKGERIRRVSGHVRREEMIRNWNHLQSMPAVSNVAKQLAIQQAKAREREQLIIQQYAQYVDGIRQQALAALADFNEIVQGINDRMTVALGVYDNLNASVENQLQLKQLDIKEFQGCLTSYKPVLDQLQGRLNKYQQFMLARRDAINQAQDSPEILEYTRERLVKNHHTIKEASEGFMPELESIITSLKDWTNRLNELVKEVEVAKKKAQAAQEEKEKAIKKEEEKRKREEKEKQQQQQQQQQQPQQQQQQPAPAAKKEVAMPQGMEGMTSVTALKEYQVLMKEREALQALAATIDSDPAKKKLRWNAKKAITSALNKIARKWTSVQLVQQDLVKAINATKHDEALYAAARLHAAEKFVLRGETGVHVNKDEAYAVAAVFVKLCNSLPDLMSVILGEFAHRCPYLVPIYKPRPTNMHDNDYRLSIGYKKRGEGDELETDEQYEERMRGFVRVFAAMVQTVLPNGEPNPFGLEHGWTWTARVVNLKPRHITADILLGFLE